MRGECFQADRTFRGPTRLADTCPRSFRHEGILAQERSEIKYKIDFVA